MTARIRAFLIHFLISVLVALAAMALVFGLWYPAPLHTALGVTGVFVLLLAVDVVLGPCLTLVVFKPGKKTLVMDLAVIAALQVAALVYGLHTVAEGRPVWMVFAHDRFDVVRAVDVDADSAKQASALYQKPSWFGPQWVALPSFNGTQEQNALQLQLLIAGQSASSQPALYQPLVSQQKAVRLNALPLQRLEKLNMAADLDAALAAYPEADSWLPLNATQQNMVVLLDKRAGVVVGLVDLKGW